LGVGVGVRVGRSVGVGVAVWGGVAVAVGRDSVWRVAAGINRRCPTTKMFEFRQLRDLMPAMETP